jgi:arginine/lysine/histidine transporter system substrate-binding protein
LLLAAAAAVAAAVPAPAQEGKALRVLVVPNDPEPEFFCLKADCPPGFDREILEGFAASKHLRLEPVPIAGWDQLIPALNAGQGDVIAGRFTFTETRARSAAFTTEVFPTRNVVVTNNNVRRPIFGLEELRQERVGTVAGSSMAEAIAAAGVPGAQVDSSYTSVTLADALRSGKARAVVLGIERAILLGRRYPGLETGLYLGPPGKLAFAVRREDEALLRELNAYLAAHRQSGRWSRLLVKYFGPAAPEVLKRARAAE